MFYGKFCEILIMLFNISLTKFFFSNIIASIEHDTLVETDQRISPMVEISDKYFSESEEENHIDTFFCEGDNKPVRKMLLELGEYGKYQSRYLNNTLNLIDELDIVKDSIHIQQKGIEDNFPLYVECLQISIKNSETVFFKTTNFDLVRLIHCNIRYDNYERKIDLTLEILINRAIFDLFHAHELIGESEVEFSASLSLELNKMDGYSKQEKIILDNVRSRAFLFILPMSSKDLHETVVSGNFESNNDALGVVSRKFEKNLWRNGFTI